jgi:hypothetical protein
MSGVSAEPMLIAPTSAAAIAAAAGSQSEGVDFRVFTVDQWVGLGLQT